MPNQNVDLAGVEEEYGLIELGAATDSSVEENEKTDVE